MTDDAYRPLPAGPDVPTPSHAHYRYGEPTKTWAYLDQDQNILYYISRYDPPGEKKQFCPQTWDGQQWQWKAWPPKRAIYNLDRLAARPDAWASVVEGEKCTDAVDQLLPRCIPTTAAGGCGALHLADWSPLYGRSNVILWPDNDPKSLAAFANLAAHLSEHSPDTKIHLIDPTGEGEKGWDSFDALKANWTPASTAAWAKTRTRIYDGPRESPWKPTPAPSRARMSDEDRELSLQLDRQEAVRQQAPEWPEPQNLFIKPVLPTLKSSHLPAAIRDHVFDQAAIIGSDPGITAIAALVTASGVADKEIVLELTRTKRRKWTERPILWGLWIAGSASKKTPAMLAALDAARDIDKEWSEQYIAKLDDYNVELKVHKECETKYIKDRAKAAMNGGGFSSRVPPPKAPQNKRILTDDYTTESLAALLMDNPRGLLVPQDELQGWFGLMDAYGKSNGVVGKDKAKWLKSHSGGAERHDRIGRGSIMVPNWALSVMGGSQPELFRELSAKLPEDGLVQRFMVVMARDANTSDESVDDSASYDRYEAMLRWLSAMRAPEYPITLSDEGHKERERMENDIYGTSGMAGISPRMKSHVGKMSGLFGRLCITFHLIEAADRRIAPPPVVSGATAHMAADFIREYLAGHIRSFYDDLLAEAKHRQHALWIAGLILGKKLTEIDNRRIQQSYDRWETLPEWTRENAMRMLEDAAWLTPATRNNPGRRVNRWDVNPLVHVRFVDIAEQEAKRRESNRQMLRDNLLARAIVNGRVQ